MLVYGELERAQIEALSANPTVGVLGRVFWNTTDGRVRIDDGSAFLDLLLNDGNIIIGTDGTAANNLRLHRGGNGILQTVLGSDSTVEGTLSTNIGQHGLRHENFTDAGKPAFGNAGRVIWITDLTKLQVDTGAAWVDVDTTGGGGEANTASNVGTGAGQLFKQKTGVDLEIKTLEAGVNVNLTNNTDEVSVASMNGVTGPLASDHTAVVGDTLIQLNTSAAVRNVDLPALSAANDGKLYFIKKSTTNNGTVTPNGADTIEGSASFTLDEDNECIVIMADFSNTNWVLIAQLGSTGGGGGPAGGIPTSDEVRIMGGEDTSATLFDDTDRFNMSGGKGSVTQANIANALDSPHKIGAAASNATTAAVFGGVISGTSTPSDNTQLYVIASDSGTDQVAALPEARRDMNGASDGEDAWSFGGSNTSSTAGAQNTISKTLIATIAWANITETLGDTRIRMAAIPKDTTIWSMVGDNAGGAATRDVEEFDTTGDSGNGTTTTHTNILGVGNGKEDGASLGDDTNSRIWSVAGDQVNNIRAVNMAVTPTEHTISLTMANSTQQGEGGFNDTIGIHTGGWNGAAAITTVESVQFSDETKQTESVTLNTGKSGMQNAQVNR